MKVFFVFIIKSIALILMLALLLDFVFTGINKSSVNRNKVENVINTKDKNLDLVILGSSRAKNHLVAQMFVDKGVNAFNYGMSGSKLEETLLLLKIMIANDYKIKNIILEIDMNINSESYSFGNRALFMPYLHTNRVVKDFYKQKALNFNKLYYIPFYRYIEFESKIGFREVFFKLIKKPSSGLENYGFYPLYGVGKKMSYDLSSYIPKKNSSYEIIKKICLENDINLIAISTPMCSDVKRIEYFDEIKNVYPEVYNYENVINDDNFFSSCGHLNQDGAKEFTRVIVNDFIAELKREK